MLTLPDSGRLRARLHSVHARGRVADALLGVALDVVQPFASDYLSADEFNHLSELVQAPVDAATQAALTTGRIEGPRSEHAFPPRGREGAIADGPGEPGVRTSCRSPTPEQYPAARST